jgi:hypothetical protein
VKVVASERDGKAVLSGIIDYRNRTFGPTVVLDADQRIVEADCSCNFYTQNKLFKGPCEHMLATRIAHARRLSRFEAPAPPPSSGPPSGAPTGSPVELRSIPAPGEPGAEEARRGLFRRLADRISGRKHEARSTQLVNLAIERAVRDLGDRELIEIERKGWAPLVDEMLAATFHARGMDDAIGRACDALLQSDHVAEIYGEDDQILAIIRQAFEAVARTAGEGD